MVTCTKLTLLICLNRKVWNSGSDAQPKSRSQSTGCTWLLQLVLHAVADHVAPQLRIAGIGRQQSQRFFGILPRQILLSVCQIRIGETVVGVGRLRIGGYVELQDVDR